MIQGRAVPLSTRRSPLRSSSKHWAHGQQTATSAWEKTVFALAVAPGGAALAADHDHSAMQSRLIEDEVRRNVLSGHLSAVSQEIDDRFYGEVSPGFGSFASDMLFHLTF